MGRREIKKEETKPKILGNNQNSKDINLGKITRFPPVESPILCYGKFSPANR
jgi:hypothetical protein